MKNQFPIVLLVLGGLAAGNPAWAKAKFNIAPSGGGKIQLGYCHMDYCDWYKIISNKIVRQSGGETVVKTKYRFGISLHPKVYPKDGVIPKNIKWDKPETATVVCSYPRPQVIYPKHLSEQPRVLLNFKRLSSMEERVANFYFAVCHNYYGGYYTVEKGYKKFGYQHKPY